MIMVGGPLNAAEQWKARYEHEVVHGGIARPGSECAYRGCDCNAYRKRAARLCTCGAEASKRWPGQHAQTCPQYDAERDERLRADLAAIKDAERQAMRP